MKLIAGQFDLDEAALVNFAHEDDYGGWHNVDSLSKWPVGSIWAAEGQVLYALTRLQKPDLTVEIGTHRGCSATHFAAAHKANATGGRHIAIDLYESSGDMIPADLRPYVEQVFAEGIHWIQDYPAPGEIGILFEDGAHDAESAWMAWLAAMPKLATGGFMISHDAMHAGVGPAVRSGIIASGAEGVRFYGPETDGMDTQHLCGLALWRAPLDRVFETEPQPVIEDVDIEPPKRKAPTRKPAPKRKAKAT